MSMLVSGLLVLATGCDADGEAAGLADRVLIGEIDDDTFVAVITDADTVLAYVCDGTPATVSVATWFVGTHDGAGFSLTHTSGARLVGAIEGELVRGQYSFGDAALEYAVADADGEAGLFLADEGELRMIPAIGRGVPLPPPEVVRRAWDGARAASMTWQVMAGRPPTWAWIVRWRWPHRISSIWR